MNPAEADDKIVKLLRLAAQRDNANEAAAARQMACKIAERHGRDIGSLERVAADEPRRPAPGGGAPSPGMTSEEFAQAVRDFGAVFLGEDHRPELDLLASLFRGPPPQPATASDVVTRIRQRVARDQERLAEERHQSARQRLRKIRDLLRKRVAKGSRKFGGT